MPFRLMGRATVSSKRESAAAWAQPPLLWAVRVCLALLLLTPFVITTATYFPFVVGKAVYSRTVIALLLCLWTALVVLRGLGGRQGVGEANAPGGTRPAKPSFGPPRSMLLVLLAAGLVAHAVATFFGVSPTRSVWSTYERMQGLVDSAHWFAFFLVAVSVLREPGGMRALLNANLGVALVIGCLAVWGYFLGEVPFINAPERDAPRVGSVFGNATYLGAYAATNILVAAGFFARSFVGAAANGESATSRTADKKRPGDEKRSAQSKRDRNALLLWRAFWAATALTGLLALIFSGSFTALVALGGGLGFLVVAAAVFARSRGVRRFALAVGLLGCVGLVAGGTLFFFPGAFPAITETTPDHPLLQRLAHSNANNISFVKRRLAWVAGIKGFAERPLLGWGPENYSVLFARHITGIGQKTELHDYAHNKIVEEAATKGVLGLACHLALWLWAFYVIWRTARRRPPADRIFALFVGAALMAYFVQQQALVDTLTLSLQLMLLFAYVVSLETAGANGRRRRIRPFANLSTWWRGARAGATLRRLAFAAFGCASVALAATSFATSQTIYAAAKNIGGFGTVTATAERPFAHVERGIADFEPLANMPRLLLIFETGRKWPGMRLRQSAEAKRLLALAEREGMLALAVEPQNWQIHATLAKLYCAAGRTEAGYLARAFEERANALALAPQMDSFLPRSLILHDRCTGAAKDNAAR